LCCIVGRQKSRYDKGDDESLGWRYDCAWSKSEPGRRRCCNHEARANRSDATRKESKQRSRGQQWYRAFLGEVFIEIVVFKVEVEVVVVMKMARLESE
jgi:hypothetical protein